MQRRNPSPLEHETEDLDDDLDVQQLDDTNAASNLGKEAGNDLEDQAVDKTEDGTEERAEEAANLSEEGADLSLDRDDNDGKDGGTGTEYEL